MASAVHIVCFVAYAGEEGTTSEAIARSLQTNAVVVRKMLKLLEGEGLVELRQGKNGGVVLARDPADITLGQIYKAVEREEGVLSMRSQVSPRCPVARGMRSLLPAVFGSANEAVQDSLSRTTVAGLLSAIP
ncbi:MAG TPA: Rrf2 family transcriptional regulator [Burkholderiales bacterium]|nr:Rrf2 family transcriptional regulator [Burkholderiales bacterium]